jgi:hypothetical protein
VAVALAGVGESQPFGEVTCPDISLHK